MPKTYGNIWNDFLSFENMYRAFVLSRKHRRFNKEIIEFSLNSEERIRETIASIKNKTWIPGKPLSFMVYDPKLRQIVAPPFVDRIVHHAFVLSVNEYFEKRFIYHSYACRKNKGNHLAVHASQKNIRHFMSQYGSCYMAKCDVSKYFASLSHDIIMNRFSSVISDANMNELLFTIISSYGNGIGIPTGSLISQLIGNFVLDFIDHECSDTFGIKYIRYMDDMVCFHSNKNEARQSVLMISELLDSLDLKLNPKSRIINSVSGLDFCGYRIWHTHILPRKRNIYKWKRKLKHISKIISELGIDGTTMIPYISSFDGYCSHCSSYISEKNILIDLEAL